MLTPNAWHNIAIPQLFARGLGVAYFFAFAALVWQVRGLWGQNGLLPITRFLNTLEPLFKGHKKLRLPSLFWIDASDRTLWSATALGVALSVLLILGGSPLILLPLLWILYLSFVVVGQDFMSFQWDTLLLETTIAGFFYIMCEPAQPIALYAMWALAARFFWSTGIVKLMSRDPAWRNLTALNYHYFTQPIPNRIAWWMHQMPQWTKKASTVLMFAVEFLAPLLIFIPHPWARLAAFSLFAFLQLVLFATGNFAFLNVLTIVICLPLLDTPQVFAAASIEQWIALCGGACIIAINVLQLFRHAMRLAIIERFLATLGPWHITGSYGLFAVMTKQRVEIIVEGSNDTLDWKAYEFRFKPGNPRRAPPQIAPFHPRLDWQMWFAALRPHSVDPWLEELVRALQQGRTDVIGLLKYNPFPNHPPAHVRLRVVSYRFSDRFTHNSTGAFWITSD